MRYNVLKFSDKFGKNCRVFLTSKMKGSLHTLAKNVLIPLSPPGQNVQYVQYAQNVVFSFEKGSNCQKDSLSGSHYPTKIYPQQNFTLLQLQRCSYPLMPFENFLGKLINSSIIFVYQLFSIMLTCFIKIIVLDQIMRYISFDNFWRNCTQISQMPQKMIFLGNYVQIFLVQLECLIIKKWILRCWQ